MSSPGALVRRAWRSLPAPLRDQLRVALYNRRLAPARFSLRNGIYTTALQGETLRSWDHPFELVEGLQRYLRQYLRHHDLGPGQVVVDAGSFHGLYALWFAGRVEPGGRVFAVEPDGESLAALRRNLALNPGVHNVEVSGDLLWSFAGEVDFYPQGTVGSSAFWAPAGLAAQRQRTTTLDALCAALPRLDFVKMDIEGAEVHALRGAEQTIRRLRPAFAIASYHQVGGGPTWPAVEELFRSMSYGFETVFYGRECMTYGWAPEGRRHDGC